MKRITREEIACELGRLLADQAILPHRGMTLPGATITVECNAQRIPKTNLGDLEICLVPVGPMEGENAELLAVERKVCESLLTDTNPGVQQGAKERLSRLALPPVEKGALAGHKLELRQQRTKREAVLTQTTDEQGVALFKLVVLDTPCELSIAVAEVWVGRGTTPVPRVTTKGRTDGLPSPEPWTTTRGTGNIQSPAPSIGGAPPEYETVVFAASTGSSDETRRDSSPEEWISFSDLENRQVKITLSARPAQESELEVETKDSALAGAAVGYDFGNVDGTAINGTMCLEPEDGLWRGYARLRLTLEQARTHPPHFVIRPKERE